MTVDVSLMSKGRISPDDLTAFIEDLSGRPALARKLMEDETMSAFEVEFKNPSNRCQTRLMRFHHSTNTEEKYAQEIGYGNCTYMSLGLHDRSEEVMRAIAARWGGYLQIDDPESIEYIAPEASLPKP